MYCTLCGSKNDLRTVGFKTSCCECDEYLHSCIQCTLFDHRTDRCRSLTTGPVADRGKFNHCQEYMPNTDPEKRFGKSRSRSSEDFNALFGDGDG